MQPHHVKRVRNGFNSGWKPSGYRDVKVNIVVNGHLCEIQLHLGSFFKLKDGQHEVYEWARELKVSTEMDADHLFKMWSPGITEEMVRLAQQNWRRTRFYLPDLLADAAQYVQAEEGYKEVSFCVEDIDAVGAFSLRGRSRRRTKATNTFLPGVLGLTRS